MKLDQGWNPETNIVGLMCEACKEKFSSELSIDDIECPKCKKKSKIKAKLRSYIVPSSKDHMLISIDLSQAESWIVAYLANESSMKWALNNSDIHYETAGHFAGLQNPSLTELISKISKQDRYTGKKCNHAFAYRMSYQRFVQVYNKEANDNGIPEISNARASQLRDLWLQRYVLNPWWESIEHQLGETRTLTTPYGRMRTFFGTWGMELFKAATAHLPQSTVSDHFRGAIQEELGIEGGTKVLVKKWDDRFTGKNMCKFTNDSHDSIVADILRSAKDEYIESAIKYIRRPLVINNETFTIPVSVEIGERWGELEEIKI